jgi:hypothetical protein
MAGIFGKVRGPPPLHGIQIHSVPFNKFLERYTVEAKMRLPMLISTANYARAMTP